MKKIKSLLGDSKEDLNKMENWIMYIDWRTQYWQILSSCEIRF